MGATDRQQRENRCCSQGEAELIQQAAPRSVTGEPPGEDFAKAVGLEGLSHERILGKISPVWLIMRVCVAGE